MNSSRPSLRKSTSYVVAAKIISKIIALLASIFIARLMGSEGQGALSKIHAGGNLVFLLASFNTAAGITYFTSNQKIEAGRMLSIGLRSFLISILLAGIIIAGTWLSGFGYLLFPENFNSTFYITYFCLFTVILLLNNIFNSFLRGSILFKDMYYTSIINAFLKLILFASIYYLGAWIFADFNIKNGFQIFLLLSVISLLIYLYFFYKNFKSVAFEQHSNAEMKQYFAYSGTAFLALLPNFLSKNLDIWFIEVYENLSELGLYAIAVALSQILLTASATLRSVLFPYISKAERPEQIRLLKQFSRINSSLILLMVIGAFFLGPMLIPLLYGEEFLGSIAPFQILLLAIACLAIRSSFAVFNMATDHNRYNVVANWSALFLIIVLDVLLIPDYGIVGAAWASVMGYFLSTVITIGSVIFLQKIPFGNYFFLNMSDWAKLKRMMRN